MMTNSYHTPVLLHAAVDGLNINPQGTYVDVTYGGGGHSALILSKLTTGKLFAFDQDADAEKNVSDHPNLIFIAANFRFLANFLQLHGVNQIDGLLADLGVSSHQFDDSTRGFSFRFENRLDMRMDKGAALDAYNVINTYEESKLADIFYLYGELRNARQIAKQISIQRRAAAIETTSQLNNLLEPMVPQKMRTGFMAQVFQAIRIEVNQELEVLRELLESSTSLLKPNGRLSIISYHSLEDRMVKNFFRSGNINGHLEKDFYGNPIRPLKEITRKPIVPDEKEIETNSRARSAKLRIAEKI